MCLDDVVEFHRSKDDHCAVHEEHEQEYPHECSFDFLEIIGFKFAVFLKAAHPYCGPCELSGQKEYDF